MHPFAPLLRPSRRLAAALLATGTVLLTAVGPAAAVEPIDLRDAGPPPRPVPVVVVPPETAVPAPVLEASPSPAASASASPSTVDDAVGYDVSYPQCGADLPEAFAFAIVGVNGGRVYRPNPCLGDASGDGSNASQLAWAGRDVELYANTGNPGPDVSRYWPTGQSVPRPCTDPGWPGGPDTRDCSYLYGWNAAADAYRVALDAFVSVGWADADAEALPWPTTWWLDVETANSWRADPSLNVAALEGARDYLESMDVEEVGFYSTPRLWNRITGGTDAFADHPAWHAGARDRDDALERCDRPSFTGGELRMVQWVEDGLDANVRCP